MPHTQIVQSTFDFAFREINAKDVSIMKREDDTDAELWDQAADVVAQLDAGLSQREAAARWINARTGETYSQMHVSFVARLVREKLTFQPRPRFREAYNEIANATSHTVTRFASQTGDVEWYSPPVVVNAARDVLGAIDLDPASCEVANTVVQASQIYTLDDNGLEQPWCGRVFMNPPYRHPDVLRFCEKFAAHAKAGDIQGIVLMNNTTDTQAFCAISAVGTAFCWPRRRLAFWKADRGELDTAMQGQVIVYSGPEPAAFGRRFAEVGLVLFP